jgi:arsenical pump membrane protein
MPHPVRLTATLLIFAASVALTVRRPRGIHEAWWTCSGAGAMLLLGLVTLRDVADVLRSARDPLLFLLALLVLAELLERSGFFDWAAIRAARAAGGDARRLYRNVFVLGAAVTVVLSLDTTAVILTPLVLAFVERLSLPAKPYVFACAFVSNTASLLLPISNLTNLLFAGTFGFTFLRFAAVMLAPQLVSLAVTFALLRWVFREQLPPSFSLDRLPLAASVVPHPGYFNGAVGALALVCAGYFVAPVFGLQPYVPAFAVATALGVYGLWTGQVQGRDLGRRIGWSVFPFVIGLFVLVRGIEHLGLAFWAVQAAGSVASRREVLLPLIVAGSAAASNVVNNLPAALLTRTILQALHAGPLEVYGALLGTNIGPNVVTFGSLATILVLGRARGRVEPVTFREFFRVGSFVTPLVLAAATLTLALVGAALGPEPAHSSGALSSTR